MSELILGRPLPARVLSVDERGMILQAQPQLGCATCEQGGGCQGGLLGRLVGKKRGQITLPLPGFECRPGSTVWLTIPPGHLLRIALLTYGLPVLALLLSAVILDAGSSTFHWLAVALIAIFAVLAPQRAAVFINPGVLRVSESHDGAAPGSCARR